LQEVLEKFTTKHNAKMLFNSRSFGVWFLEIFDFRILKIRNMIMISNVVMGRAIKNGNVA